ncbi:hypothetical protein AB0K21_22125 [Streptosporangium sp. NPDC049248]|uniref:hypothetical protein n=1 Tax=Streptosporangium sp. NPDC049248 TaxID=3155651 RepID=UPI003439278F
MFFYMNVADDNGSPATAALDTAASSYYRQNSTDLSNYVQYQPGVPPIVYTPQLFFICVRAQRSGQNPEWAVYAFISRDQPGWPINMHDTVLAPTAQDIAQGLVSAGHTVAVRRYDDFHVAFTAATVPLV